MLFAGRPTGPDGTGDDLFGGAGNDRLRGDTGIDRVEGGPGNDNMTGGDDEDDLVGGTGNDRIDARDGAEDTIDCGAGEDTVLVDVGRGRRHRLRDRRVPAGPARPLALAALRASSRASASCRPRFTECGLREDLVRLAVVGRHAEPVRERLEAGQVVRVGLLGVEHAPPPPMEHGCDATCGGSGSVGPLEVGGLPLEAAADVARVAVALVQVARGRSGS